MSYVEQLLFWVVDTDYGERNLWLNFVERNKGLKRIILERNRRPSLIYFGMYFLCLIMRQTRSLVLRLSGKSPEITSFCSNSTKLTKPVHWIGGTQNEHGVPLSRNLPPLPILPLLSRVEWSNDNNSLDNPNDGRFIMHDFFMGKKEGVNVKVSKVSMSSERSVIVSRLRLYPVPLIWWSGKEVTGRGRRGLLTSQVRYNLLFNTTTFCFHTLQNTTPNETNLHLFQKVEQGVNGFYFLYISLTLRSGKP